MFNSVVLVEQFREGPVLVPTWGLPCAAWKRNDSASAGGPTEANQGPRVVPLTARPMPLLQPVHRPSFLGLLTHRHEQAEAPGTCAAA